MSVDEMVRLIVDKNDMRMNLALDESLLDLVNQGKAPETVRIYEFDRPALCIGNNQSMDEVNHGVCAAADWDVCVRSSGGTLAYLSPWGKIAVSRVYRKEKGDFDTIKHTQMLCKDIIGALNDLGVEKLELWNKCDIMAYDDGRWKKIASAAADMSGSATLAHATINIRYTPQDISLFLRTVKPFGDAIENGIFADTVSAVSDFVTSTQQTTKKGRFALIDALQNRFAQGVTRSEWSDEELALAKSHLSVIGKRTGGSDYKGLCDFGIGAYIPAFIIHKDRPLAVPYDLMLNVSERNELRDGKFVRTQERDKNAQLRMYREWRSSLK